jgi:hypothetical protein
VRCFTQRHRFRERRRGKGASLKETIKDNKENAWRFLHTNYIEGGDQIRLGSSTRREHLLGDMFPNVEV